jgi:hypothetical protein
VFGKLKFSVAPVITLPDGNVTPGTVTVNAGFGELLEFRFVPQMAELSAQLFEVQLSVAVALTLLDPDEERESPNADEGQFKSPINNALINKTDFLNLSLRRYSPSGVALWEKHPDDQIIRGGPNFHTVVK